MKIVYLFMLLFALIVGYSTFVNAQSYIETYLQKRRTKNEILRVYYENKYCPQTPELCLNYKSNSRRDND